jgi:cell division protein FtsL
MAAEMIYKKTVAYSLQNRLQKLRRSVKDYKKEVRSRFYPQKRKQTLKRFLQITLKLKI